MSTHPIVDVGKVKIVPILDISLLFLADKGLDGGGHLGHTVGLAAAVLRITEKQIN